MPMNKKLECKDHQHIPKCWERSVKRNSNLNFISHQKFIFWSTFCIYLVQTFLKILCWRFLYLPCSGSACSDFTEGFGWSTLVVFENFLVFYFPFSQFPELLLHFRCCNPYVVGLLISDDLDQRCKVDSLSTYFFNFLKPFHIASICHS